MRNFAAIDFETANHYPSSVCSVGVVVVREDQVCETFYSLIHPEPDYYNWHNSRVHGLTRADTDGAPSFRDVWYRIEPLIADLPLVAHNKSFDESCLKACFKTYNMDYPDYRFYCTYRDVQKKIKDLSDYKLHTVSLYCGYNLTNHHHALEDAIACAWIAQKLL